MDLWSILAGKGQSTSTSNGIYKHRHAELYKITTEKRGYLRVYIYSIQRIGRRGWDLGLDSESQGFIVSIVLPNSFRLLLWIERKGREVCHNSKVYIYLDVKEQEVKSRYHFFFLSVFGKFMAYVLGQGLQSLFIFSPFLLFSTFWICLICLYRACVLSITPNSCF